MEDFSEEIQRRKERLSHRVILSCVTADTLEDDGLREFYVELNYDSCLQRNWRGLAGKLLKQPPTISTIETLSKSKNPGRDLLRTWEEQCDAPNTFESLIAAMVTCKLYSACDELLEYLENCEKDSRLGLDELPEELEENVCYKPMDISDEISEHSDNERNTNTVNEQQQQRANTDSPCLKRSTSCPADVGWFSRFRKSARRIFKRSKSYPPVDSCQLPQLPVLPELPEDEIFVVSSNTDHQTKDMQELMSFVYKLKPVTKGTLTVKTIHDLEHHGQVMTTWLQERVNRAKYVILCFSEVMKRIADDHTDTPQFQSQTDYKIKFTIDILVNGTLFTSCKNPNGKFIPVLLPGNDISTLIFPLMLYMNFSWPRDRRSISNYIMDLPDHPIPPQGTPKPLVRVPFSWDR